MSVEEVERAMRGDHDAFAALIDASANRIFALASLILRDSDRAQDATQEAIVRAWRELPRLRDPERFEAWLRRMVVNACYDEGRKTRRRAEVSLVNLADHQTIDPTTRFAESERIDRAFRRLPLRAADRARPAAPVRDEPRRDRRDTRGPGRHREIADPLRHRGDASRARGRRPGHRAGRGEDGMTRERSDLDLGGVLGAWMNDAAPASIPVVVLEEAFARTMSASQVRVYPWQRVARRGLRPGGLNRSALVVTAALLVAVLGVRRAWRWLRDRTRAQSDSVADRDSHRPHSPRPRPRPHSRRPRSRPRPASLWSGRSPLRPMGRSCGC